MEESVDLHEEAGKENRQMLPKLVWVMPRKLWANMKSKLMFLFLCFLVWPYNKHLINRARLVCMGESWPQSLVQPSLRSVSNGDLSQDSPIQTSRSVNKSQLNSLLCVTSSLNPFTLSKLLANIANWASRRYVFS